VKVQNWLPPGKRAAVCFTIDDVHPGKSLDAYEAGGDLDRGALGHLAWLLARHPELRVTLFVTADWRETSPAITRHIAARIPVVRDSIFLAETLPAGTMRLSRHPHFVAYLRSLPRTDVALHGLYHIQKGPRIAAEFFGRSRAECTAMIARAIEIFREANLPYSPGMCPPSWDLSQDLAEAMVENGLIFVASARDIRTAVSADSVNAMSGLRGVSLIYPERIQQGRLIHFTANFQATSPMDRAIQIVEMNGLLAIKAHIVKNACGHIALDGLDELYRNYLDLVFSELERRYGESLWWTSMAEIASLNLKDNGLSQPELAESEA
jgi:predicted deacetylase